MNPNARRIGLVVIVLAFALTIFLNRSAITEESLNTVLDGLGVWAPLVFILIYCLAPVLFFPPTLLTVLGGFIFGPWWTALYVFIGGSIGAGLAFLVGRYLAQEWVEKNAKGMLAKIKTGVEEGGWRYVAVSRLIPVMPFTILNFAFGLTRMPLRTYIWSSGVFMMPGTLVYAYMGHLGQELAFGGDNLFTRLMICLFALALIGLVGNFCFKRSS